METISNMNEASLYTGPNKVLDPSETQTLTIKHGYNLNLNGWTHMDQSSMGYIRNDVGTARAIIDGLICGKVYYWALYQYVGNYDRGKIFGTKCFVILKIFCHFLSFTLQCIALKIFKGE